jgi:hypothetical protein
MRESKWKGRFYYFSLTILSMFVFVIYHETGRSKITTGTSLLCSSYVHIQARSFDYDVGALEV